MPPLSRFGLLSIAAFFLSALPAAASAQGFFDRFHTQADASDLMTEALPDPHAEPDESSVVGIVAADEAHPELNYRNILPLYIATWHELLDNDGFAWHYFEIFKAPEGEACTELIQETRNAARFSELVERERDAFREDLATLADRPMLSEFTTSVMLTLLPYDPVAQAFPVESMELAKVDFRPELLCAGTRSPAGVSYVPEVLVPVVTTESRVTQWPIVREDAMDFIERNGLSFTGGSLEIRGVATVYLDMVPLTSTAGQVTLPLEVREVAIVDPASGETLHRFGSEMFPLRAAGRYQHAMLLYGLQR